MRKLFRNLSLQAEFEKRGYIIVDFLTPDTINEIVRICETLTPDDKFDPANRYHCTFIDTNEEYKTKANELFKQYCNKLIENIFIDYEILTGNFYIKQPGTGEFEVHQNWNVLDETKYTSVTIWIPLHNTNEQNGTIEVVEGSNKIINNISTLHLPYFFNDFESRIKEKYLKPVELKLGQAIIFDDNLVHYSKNNNSDTARKAIQLMCVPKEAQLIFYYADPKNKKYIEKYETSYAFYLKHNLTHVLDRPPLKYLGKMRNNNILLSEESFVELLEKGEEIREKIYSAENKIQKSKLAAFLNKIFLSN